MCYFSDVLNGFWQRGFLFAYSKQWFDSAGSERSTLKSAEAQSSSFKTMLPGVDREAPLTL